MCDLSVEAGHWRVSGRGWGASSVGPPPSWGLWRVVHLLRRHLLVCIPSREGPLCLALLSPITIFLQFPSSYTSVL